MHKARGQNHLTQRDTAFESIFANGVDFLRNNELLLPARIWFQDTLLYLKVIFHKKQNSFLHSFHDVGAKRVSAEIFYTPWQSVPQSWQSVGPPLRYRFGPALETLRAVTEPLWKLHRKISAPQCPWVLPGFRTDTAAPYTASSPSAFSSHRKPASGYTGW